MRFGADTPGRQFRENSRERGRRSPAGGLQGSKPPSPSTDVARAKRESGGRRARPAGRRHTFRRGAARGERARADGVRAQGSSHAGRGRPGLGGASRWRGTGATTGFSPGRANRVVAGLCGATGAFPGATRATGRCSAPGRRRGLLSVRGGWRGARRAGAGGTRAGGTRAGGARRRGGAAGTVSGDSSGGVCRVSLHHGAVVPPGRREFFRTAGGKPPGFRGGARRGASTGSGFFLYARVKGLVATKVCPALVWLDTLRYLLVNLLYLRTGVMYVARARTARRRGRETPGGKEPHS